MHFNPRKAKNKKKEVRSVLKLYSHSHMNIKTVLDCSNPSAITKSLPNVLPMKEMAKQIHCRTATNYFFH